MTESAVPTPEENKPARDMRPVQITPATPPPPRHEEGPRDLTPISWGGTYDDSDDFRPQIAPSEAPDPKGSSAAESADFSEQQSDLIPTLSDVESSSPPPDLESPASAEKVSTGQPPAPSKPTSSPSPNPGQSKQTV